MGNPMLLLDIVPTWHHPLVSCHLEYGKEQRSWSNADCRYYSVVVVVVVVALVLVVVVVADFASSVRFFGLTRKRKKGPKTERPGRTLLDLENQSTETSRWTIFFRICSSRFDAATGRHHRVSIAIGTTGTKKTNNTTTQRNKAKAKAKAIARQRTDHDTTSNNRRERRHGGGCYHRRWT